MKTTIEERLERNLSRVRKLINVYQNSLAGSGQGRRGHAQTDVLRAATVFLHATMEDLVRSVAYWKLPTARAEALGNVPFVKHGALGKKFSLSDMASLYRGKGVDEVITESTQEYLARSNYNTTQDLSSALGDLGIDVAQVNSQFAVLEQLMKRRHQIVHRADQDETGGSGKHKVKSLGKKQVKQWADAVEVFGRDVLQQL